MKDLRKVFGMFLMFVIAFSLASTTYVTAVIIPDGGGGGGGTTMVAEPYSGYCKQVISYQWRARESTQSVATGDDRGTWISYKFTFFGEVKSRVYVCSNGFLIFDPTAATVDWTNSLKELKARWKIAVFWDDLRTDRSGGIVSTPGVYVDFYSDDANWNPDADVNGDWVVDDDDLEIVLNAYGSTPGDPNWDPRADINGDGIVDILDAVILSHAYGSGCNMVITWEATRFRDSSDSIKFQAVLFQHSFNIRMSLDDATNLADFSPTLGVSKGTKADFIHFTGEKATRKTWFFHYDCGCFCYDRCGPWPYPTKHKCLTPSGWVDHGYCYCGPPNSRNFVPDYLKWYLGTTYLLTDLKYTENLYAAAQEWSGRDFCYTVEYNMPRAHGSVTGWYSTLPNVVWNPPDDEDWAGVPTWEWDAHTFTPEQIQENTIYWVDTYLSMNTGYTPGGSIGQESELYDDGWCFLCWRPEPNGVQNDYWKQYLGSYWIEEKDLSRTMCETEKVFLEILRFSGGSISVAEVGNSSVIKIRMLPDVRSWEGVATYISSRIDATKKLVENVDPSQPVPVTVTFNTHISPLEYMQLVRRLGVKVSSYNIIGNEGAGGSVAPSKQMPYDWAFEATLKIRRGIEVSGVTGFYGLIPAGNVETLQNDLRVILVDPMEDLTILQLKQKYIDQGYPVQVYYPVDLWIYCKMLSEG